MSANLPEESQGAPDWEQAIKSGQAAAPSLDSPALAERAARQAAMVAKFTAANHREK